MKLDELITVRITHDLASGITTLQNTLELLKMDKSAFDETFPFLNKASFLLSARLKYYRACFGLNQTFSPTIYEDYIQTLNGAFEIKAIPTTQLDLVLLLFAFDYLGQGGKIELKDNILKVSGRIFPYPHEQEILNQFFENVSAKEVPLMWLKINHKIQFDSTPHLLTIKVLSHD